MRERQDADANLKDWNLNMVICERKAGGMDAGAPRNEKRRTRKCAAETR